MNRLFLAFLICLGAIVQTASGFVEYFNGSGEFESVQGEFSGLNHSGWEIFGDGEISSKGYIFQANPMRDELVGHVIRREQPPSRNFFHRVEARDFAMEPVDRRGGGASRFRIQHDFARDIPGFNAAAVWIFENNDDDRTWKMGHSINGILSFVDVIPGANISLELTFDDGEVIFGYDNDIDDELTPISIGPFQYEDDISDLQGTQLIISADLFGNIHGVLESWEWEYEPGVEKGDFNSDGILDIVDISLLSVAIRESPGDDRFDLNNDQSVDSIDHVIWVHDLAMTWFGDSNLDGEFNTNDLVSVFQAGEYEDQLEGNSTWATGDWNGDAEFNTRDLVLAFQDDGYEAGPRAVAISVSEPSGLLLPSLMASLIFFRLARVRRLSAAIAC